MGKFVVLEYDDSVKGKRVDEIQVGIDGLNYSLKDVIMKVESGVIPYEEEDLSGTKFFPLYNKYIVSKAKTDAFASECMFCGDLFYATSNTIIRRGMLLCDKCSVEYHRYNKYQSLLELVDGISNYWSDKNILKPYQVRLAVNSREKFYVICPLCGNENNKRYDAIIRSGPYCGPCAKRVNVPAGESLYDVYPITAEKYDNSGNNVLDSKHIRFGSSDKYYFRCPICKEIYYKSLQNQVNADLNGSLGCPICQGHEIRKGINDAISKNYYAKLYWDYDKNSVNPEEVYFDERGVKHWFKCSNGHSFETSLHRLNRSYNEAKSGNGCPICSGHRVVRGVNDVATLFKGDLSKWSSDSEVMPDEVSIYSNRKMIAFCSNCGQEYETEVQYFTHSMVCYCENCRKRNYSKAEKDIVEYIRSLGFNVEENVQIGGGRSIDILIRDKGIAFDYNGIYWHSTKYRSDIYYHAKKIIDCEELGIRLYYIWEDTYLSKQSVVLNWIKSKLGIFDGNKYNARDCEAYYIDKEEGNLFLDSNHIQGKVSMATYIGLRNKDDMLVALMAYTVNDNMVNILRYCSYGSVRGGFSKLLRCLENEGVYDGVYTFSDNSISDGDLYKITGFEVIDELKPDYSYVVGNKRVHKFNYRKKRFEEDSSLLYVEGMTESQLAEINNLYRVYDSGKKKWVKYF